MNKDKVIEDPNNNKLRERVRPSIVAIKETELSPIDHELRGRSISLHDQSHEDSTRIVRVWKDMHSEIDQVWQIR